ncbi:helix-turn-helix transcriptional regulator [Actinocrispum wychmicini]|uniref:Putative ArsR family transcriptional regulator n=1 Tax=Actinocrispum wychmicini TaxID=1213861 RepID=A0A4R2J955_9PSEU|nr:Rrf2 family transcriptional regulator [Actinocrispum wychmicini]TCO54302.1 putative ArsR family transcriptional regulator [Actinocrispum wychmicini]
MTESAISAVAALDDALRREMYLFIRQAHQPVTRDQAAASVGISRKLAAFHLDKLVDAGLLRAHYGQVGGIRKVGRKPKLYEPTDTDFHVTIPERRHAMLADILIDAVLTEGKDENAHQAAIRAATTHGEELGTAERDQVKGRLGAERALTLCEGVLVRNGFEPTRESPTCVRLRNCPFHPLAARATDLVCGMNHAFLTGMLTGLDAASIRAILTPRPGECCVELRSAGD